MISLGWSMENLRLSMAKGLTYEARKGQRWLGLVPKCKYIIFLPPVTAALQAGAQNSMICEVIGLCSSSITEAAEVTPPRDSTQAIFGAMSVAEQAHTPSHQHTCSLSETYGGHGEVRKK